MFQFDFGISINAQRMSIERIRDLNRKTIDFKKLNYNII